MNTKNDFYFTFYFYLFYVFSNAGSFIILLKLSYPIEKLFWFPAGFELLILLLAFDADTLTDWATAHSKSQVQYPVVLIASSRPECTYGLFLFIDCVYIRYNLEEVNQVMKTNVMYGTRSVSSVYMCVPMWIWGSYSYRPRRCATVITEAVLGDSG